MLSKGPNEDWGITKSKDQHIRSATDHAVHAMIIAGIHQVNKDPKNVIIYTQDFYKGTENDNFIYGQSKYQKFLLTERRRKQH